MSNKKFPAPLPRSGHGAASVIPHLEEDNARGHPSGYNEQNAAQEPEDSDAPETPDSEAEHPGASQ